MNPYLSVIIPAYNEEERITTTLDAVYSYLRQQAYTWEMLIVQDGGTDNTPAVVEAFARGKEQIRWLPRSQNRGKGYTIRQGMLAARGQIRLYTDADNSTDMSHFDKMKPLFDAGAEVVIGSRDRKDAVGATQATPQPAFKRFLGNAGNLIIQLFVVPGIWDTRCGFKAFTAQAAARIFAAAKMDGFSIDDEALALARRFGYQIKIIPAYWINVAGTHVTKLDYIKNIFEAVRIRWNLMTGVYNVSNASLDKLPSIEERGVNSRQ